MNKQNNKIVDEEYTHPRLGVGTIISRQKDGTIFVRFDDPPKMKANYNLAGRRLGIVPTMMFKTKVIENG